MDASIEQSWKLKLQEQDINKFGKNMEELI